MDWAPPNGGAQFFSGRGQLFPHTRVSSPIRSHFRLIHPREGCPLVILEGTERASAGPDRASYAVAGWVVISIFGEVIDRGVLPEILSSESRAISPPSDPWKRTASFELSPDFPGLLPRCGQDIRTPDPRVDWPEDEVAEGQFRW